jgi:hypothetical protein
MRSFSYTVLYFYTQFLPHMQMAGAMGGVLAGWRWVFRLCDMYALFLCNQGVTIEWYPEATSSIQVLVTERQT